MHIYTYTCIYMHRNANISIPNYIMCIQLNRIVLYIYTHEWLLHTATCIYLYNCKSLGSGCIWVTSWLHFIQAYLRICKSIHGIPKYLWVHLFTYSQECVYTQTCIHTYVYLHRHTCTYIYINIKFHILACTWLKKLYIVIYALMHILYSYVLPKIMPA